MTLTEVTMFTDGACIGNPGPGGYGVVLKVDGRRSELSGGFRRTTNNRMELTAAIAGLKQLQETSRVRLYSDSQYMVDGINQGWARQWRARGYKKKKNPDLWEQLLSLCERHQVEFIWIQGHAGIPENERCDQLSIQAAQRRNLPADEIFERAEAVQNPPALF